MAGSAIRQGSGNGFKVVYQRVPDRLAVIAEQAIPLDLDDGMVVNYAKLGDVVGKLK